MKKSLCFVLALMLLLCSCGSQSEKTETYFFHGISYAVPATWSQTEFDTSVMYASPDDIGIALNIYFGPVKQDGEPIDYNGYNGVHYYTKDNYNCFEYYFEDGAGDPYSMQFTCINEPDEKIIHSILDSVDTH